MAAPTFTSITLKSNINHFRLTGKPEPLLIECALVKPLVDSNGNSNHSSVITRCMARNDNEGAILSGSLFVPSQLSVLSEPKHKELDVVWERHLSRSTILTKSGRHLLSLPLSKMILFPTNEFIYSNKARFVEVNESDVYKPFYDGPIAFIDNARYFSLKDQRLIKFSSEINTINLAISSFGHWLVVFFGPLMSIVSLWKRVICHDDAPGPNNVACRLSSPFLADIEKKDRLLDLHRFASSFNCCARPWNCIIMAIDKSSGYLVYSDLSAFGCWAVLDSMTNYTSGDLLYFSKDGNFYVLPNSQCLDLEVWRYQNRICSKKSTIHATFMDDQRENDYHHIHAYLVESLNRDLLLVRRYVVTQKEYTDSSSNDNFFKFKTDCFEVFKLNIESNQWEVVGSLGDEAIFVGSNSSFSLSSTKYAEVIPNCIYFTDQVCHHGGDMLHGNDNGIFHLEDCTFTTLFNSEFKCIHPPLWLCPDERWLKLQQVDDDDDDDDDDDGNDSKA